MLNNANNSSKRSIDEENKNKSSLGSFNDRYAKAGAEYSNDLQELALEFFNSLVEAWDDANK